MIPTNEISQLLDSIIACGESMAKLGRALKASLPEIAETAPNAPHVTETEETNANSAPTVQPEKAESAKGYTFTDVRKAFSAKSHAGYTAQVKELIRKYGADRLSDVKEADYPSLMADLEAIE